MFRIKRLHFLIFGGLAMAMLYSPSFAQELIMPLSGNREIKDAEKPVFKKSAGEMMLELPVTDDFSQESHYPDMQIWADDDAYINNAYAVAPPTIGVATMDALDFNGSVYPFATLSPETFIADYLTSYPVNLNYPAGDSIYLSFFFQPMGNGIEPMPGDSLCLDFYDPADSLWIKVWGVPGDTLRAFRQVMIPISDTVFLKEGFRFGFRNRASIPKNPDYEDKRGNTDHWNIDYVRLGRNRHVNDTVIRDVALSHPLPSMLRNYESLPWDHFEVGFNTLYRAYIRMTYFNNDTAVRNVTRSAEIYNEVWDETYDPDNSSAQDILPGTFITKDITSIYPFDFGRGDTASYLMKAWLTTDEFDNKTNDTVVRRQLFRDYFAYDDGTAERAYGLRGQESSNGLIAVRFNSFIADELGGVDIFFAQLLDSLNLNYFFKFMVWDDDDGLPGTLIYEDDIDHTVEYTDLHNKFTRFHFKEKVPVSGTFYVGLLQYSHYLLNIGMDVNKPANGNTLYNIGDGNGWYVSSSPGSLMLRPFVSRSYSVDSKSNHEILKARIWPNPARDFIRIELPPETETSNVKMTVYDITGKEVLNPVIFEQEIFTGNLPEGVYVVKLTSDKYLFSTEKIIIRR